MIAEHEKDILILLAFMLLIPLAGIFVVSFIMGVPPLKLLLSLLTTNVWILFGLLGLGGFYFELSTLSKGIKLIEDGKEEWPVDHKRIVGVGLGLLIGALLLVLGTAGGTEKGLLESLYLTTVAGLGFSIVLFMMYLGAVVARYLRSR